MQVLPPKRPGYFAEGGVLPAGQAQQASEARLAALEDQQRISNQLLQQVVANTGTVAAYGPARLNIGPSEAVEIDRQKRVADTAAAAASL